MDLQAVVPAGGMSCDWIGLPLKVQLDQRYEPPLGIAVAIDIALRRLNGSMAGQQLNVP